MPTSTPSPTHPTETSEPRCCKCGDTQFPGCDPCERLVRDNVSGRIYCASCADEWSRIVHGYPATIRHSDGSPLRWDEGRWYGEPTHA